MQSSNIMNLLDLYIDESGGSSIGESRYRFFLISAVLLTPSEKTLADLLFAKWRYKYLRDHDKCFHAADFFEGYENKYKKSELQMPRNIKRCIQELLEILRHISFNAEVYYVDLPKLRHLYALNEPPIYQEQFKNTKEKGEHKMVSHEYQEIIQRTIGDKKKFLPLMLTLKNAFNYHNRNMDILTKENTSDRPIKGYLNFESLSGSDTMLVSYFHKLKNKVSKDYEGKIVGLNFHTKSSLGAGIELADLISYISFQTLRFKYKRVSEYSNIDKTMIQMIKDIRKNMNTQHKISLVEVTKDIV